jgi:hypothetical protein
MQIIGLGGPGSSNVSDIMKGRRAAGHCGDQGGDR